MKNKATPYLLSVVIIVNILGCARIKKTDAEKERENWISSFTDSIAYYQERYAVIESQLNNLNNEISTMVEDFDYIKNPREVSGYYLLKGWKSKIPFTTTSIYARINENEKLELIATLAGSTFNRIGVGIGASEFFTETVPHDQAFNFRHERFNTVYFSGGKADTITDFIVAHNADKVNMEFIEGDRKKNFLIPQDEKNMINQTWKLYSSQVEAHKMQKELWMCSKKIEAFRRIMDASNQRENNK